VVEEISKGPPVTAPKSGDVWGRTVLIVEDEDLLRAAVSKSLQRFGFTVVEASDGSRAVELMRAHGGALNAVLLDVTLPGMSSREVLLEARKIKPDLRVVVTSAYSKETVDKTFSGLTVHHFIRKPFHLDALVRVLRD